MATIKVNGAEFYYELHGSGQPLVLITGYTGNHAFWLPLINDLSKNYQVLIFDNRAVGYTKDDGGKFSIEDMADDTMALIHALKLHKPHIAGSSMGGNIAISIGGKYSQEISKLALLNTTMKWCPTTIGICNLFINLRKQNIDLSTVLNGMGAWIFGQDFLNNTIAFNEYIQAGLNTPSIQSLKDQLRQFEAMCNFDGHELARQITATTLVLSGREDRSTLPDEAQDLVSTIPNAKLMELPGGHVPMIELKDEFLQVLMDFLKA